MYEHIAAVAERVKKGAEAAAVAAMETETGKVEGTAEKPA